MNHQQYHLSLRVTPQQIRPYWVFVNQHCPLISGLFENRFNTVRQWHVESIERHGNLVVEAHGEDGVHKSTPQREGGSNGQ